ncbi:MAG: hypothetical protein LBG59_00550 [Candidatus Peribacteria bacterium]|nr:hypothetical protein [Candidatus Peribacteria bacterium]
MHTGELTLKNGEIRSSLGNILSNKNLVLVNYHNFPRSIDIFMKKNKDTRQLSADNFATFQKDKE